eukprot:2887332-Alexandrium_andersonii.AAC.1
MSASLVGSEMCIRDRRLLLLHLLLRPDLLDLRGEVRHPLRGAADDPHAARNAHAHLTALRARE